VHDWNSLLIVPALAEHAALHEQIALAKQLHATDVARLGGEMASLRAELARLHQMEQHMRAVQADLMARECELAVAQRECASSPVLQSCLPISFCERVQVISCGDWSCNTRRALSALCGKRWNLVWTSA
jgi:hypothetical protein